MFTFSHRARLAAIVLAIVLMSFSASMAFADFSVPSVDVTFSSNLTSGVVQTYMVDLYQTYSTVNNSTVSPNTATVDLILNDDIVEYNWAVDYAEMYNNSVPPSNP